MKPKMILLGLSMLLVLSCQVWQNAWGVAGLTQTADAPIAEFSVDTITDTITPTLTQTPNSTPTNIGTPTPDPLTVTALFMEEQSTQKAATAMAMVHEKSIIATSTASAKNAQATVNAIIITATAKVRSANLTATAVAKSGYATEIAQYTNINPNALVTDPNNYIGQSVVVRGRVFYVISNTDFQIWLEGVSDESVYVSMVNSYSDIYENDDVTVYGIVAAEACGPNPFGEEFCQPQIVGVFYEKK